MAPPSPSFFLLMVLVLIRNGAPSCSGVFRAGQDDFVLDAEDAVKGGAVLLSTAHVSSPEECERVCCAKQQCNVALLEPRGDGAEYRTCVIFDCVHRNRFACRFISQTGFRSYVKESVFLKHLGAPDGSGEHPPPIAVAGRDVVVQPGSTVTLNGVESLAVGDATISDYQWNLESGDDTVSIQKTDFPDQIQISNLHPGTSYIFQLKVTDSEGNSNTAKTTVMVLSPEQSNLYCLAPAKVGPCRASFRRWRYNATSGGCEEFVFGGCNPNNNNYLSKNECMQACSGVRASARSSTLPAAEVCESSCGTNQLTCDNGCCLDKTLECDGVKQCSDGSDEDHCSKLNQTLNRLLSIDVSQRKAWCTEFPHTGPCRASHTRWYYDPLNRKCQRFTYGGCSANDNNFEEENKCNDFCSGVTADDVYSPGMFKRFGSEEEEDESDSGSVALAVVLAVAILALLAILTYCFLRSRRKHAHRPVATGPAHVALSEQDTLVYSSTTKPI